MGKEDVVHTCSEMLVTNENGTGSFMETWMDLGSVTQNAVG